MTASSAAQRITIPDPPDWNSPIYNGNVPLFLSAVTTWGQKAKGNIYVQSATVGSSGTSVNTSISGVVITSTNDGQQCWGNGTFTTDGSGNISISHNLSGTPTFASAATLNNGTNCWIVNLISLGSTSFQICVIDTLAYGGATVNNTAVSIAFQARI